MPVSPGRSARASRTSSASARSRGRRCSSPARRQLVGLLTADPQSVLEDGAQVIAQAHPDTAVRPLGHVTSSYHSAVLGRSIAMGLVAGGRARIGETLYVPTAAGVAAVQVASPGLLRSGAERAPCVTSAPHACRAAAGHQCHGRGAAAGSALVLRGAEPARAAAGPAVRHRDPCDRVPRRQRRRARGAVAGSGRVAADRPAGRRRGGDGGAGGGTARAAALARRCESSPGRARRRRSAARSRCSRPAARSISTRSAFPPGMCTRTMLAKAEVVLWRTGAEQLPPRSVALVPRLRNGVSRRSRPRDHLRQAAVAIGVRR